MIPFVKNSTEKNPPWHTKVCTYYTLILYKNLFRYVRINFVLFSDSYISFTGTENPLFNKLKDLAKGFVMNSDILLGKYDTDDLNLGVLLGVWKPLYPSKVPKYYVFNLIIFCEMNVTNVLSKVCDYPLAIMDANTFESEFQSPTKFSMNFFVATLNNFGGAIAYSPNQKWYYYPFQNTREVLLFHQYTKNRFFANPHTSFLNKNCPRDTESRISLEARVAIFF